MRVFLPYHADAFELDLPSRSRLRVIGDSYPAPLGALREELARALDAPVGTSPLAKLLPRTGMVSILLSDLTRGGSTVGILALLLDFLEERGIGPDRVSVVVALGMHRRHAGGELRGDLASALRDRWKVIDHDARDPRSLTEVGITPAGTPCLFNTGVVRSALVIALGTVSFHYFAGYGGGRKLLLPGVAGESTILANHRLSLKRDPGEGLSSGCRSGNLDGNPVHEDMLAGARLLATKVFAINSIPDDGGHIVFLNAGELDESHRAACDFLSENFCAPIDRPYRAAIVSAGGFPKDIDLVQSHKALRHTTEALDEGGLMLVAAACSEGIGSDSYGAAFADGRLAVPDVVRRGYTLNAQTAVSTHEIAGRFSVYLRSMMPDRIVSHFGFCPWKEHFADYLLDGIADEEIVVMPNASQFLPRRG